MNIEELIPHPDADKFLSDVNGATIALDKMVKWVALENFSEGGKHPELSNYDTQVVSTMRSINQQILALESRRGFSEQMIRCIYQRAVYMYNTEFRPNSVYCEQPDEKPIKRLLK